MSFDRRPFEARGLLVVPGFIDLHAHLREPGFEESETIATGARAALRGGFTTVCAMPNTEPAIDAPGLVAQVVARAASAAGARVLPIAAITRGRRGAELCDLVGDSAHGCPVDAEASGRICKCLTRELEHHPPPPPRGHLCRHFVTAKRPARCLWFARQGSLT